MAVLHGGMAQIAQPGFAARRLAIEPAVGIAGAGMGVILALLAAEIRAIAAVAAILGAEALMRGPGLDQRAIHREMLVRQ